MNVRLLFGLLWPGSLAAQILPETFPPPDPPPVFQAVEIQEPLRIDGALDEAVWQLAPVIQGFVQQNPVQRAPASFDTEVRVLFDQQFLYVGAFCRDDYRRASNLRVQNLRRDYLWDLNDGFGVAIDGFLDKRNAVSFQTTPAGNIRDLQVIDGDTYNRDWDALWYSRTLVTDSGWYAEMAIPWKVLRYPESASEIGVIFVRNIRRFNEYTVLPAVPRVFDPYRMAYEALLTGLRPPRPSANIQLNPYLLAAAGRSTGAGASGGSTAVEAGGELKWAITPGTVLDVSVNTDFAQADVDRQVVNLERFSVLFPERRQFFLENATVFRANVTEFMQPFFSRRIGLDGQGNAIPIDGGLRLAHVSAQRSAGLLAVRQRAVDGSPQSHFAVLRYAENLGEQSRLGGMVTYRHDAALAQDSTVQAARSNYTATVDGIFRPNQQVNVQGMLSFSSDEVLGQGLASQLWASYTNNLMYVGWLGYYVRNYQPGAGIELFGRDYVFSSPAIDLDVRPDWLPAFVRSLGPDLQLDIFHTPDLRGIISADASFSAFDVTMQNGANVEARHNASWQVLDEVFSPVGDARIAPGTYRYVRHACSANSDLSKQLAGSASVEFGPYYDGHLTAWAFSGRWGPVPQIECAIDYEYNRIRDLGQSDADLDTHLIGVNARLALNPRVQLIGFYQRNTALDRDIWNVRVSWEYRPLSFLYLVFNSNQTDWRDPQNRFSQQQAIAKLTFLQQF
ncbi:MAG: DUF5916 domain-containing protein [Bacteroidia bacterium]|nr:DUF5916 domain-containing protein [Bacteroidia bacterium]